jgi:L-amino acid N-acyltransferase YncA
MERVFQASTPEGATVKPCRPVDLPAVQAIYAHYVLTSTATFEEEPPDLDYWHRRFEEIGLLGLPFLVAMVDGRVIGYTFCSRWRPRPAYRFTGEDSVYVAPDAVGRGIGSVMLAALLDRCKEAGLRETVAVIATGSNDASLRLHRRFGFRGGGRLKRVGYKFDRWLDTILLQRGLVE